jgi:hypothetical protein
MDLNQLNSYMYFFSAYAQVVAAIVSLAGLFLLFYIPVLNKRIVFWAERIIDNIDYLLPRNLFLDLITKYRVDTKSESSKEIVETINEIEKNEYYISRIKEGGIIQEKVSGAFKKILNYNSLKNKCLRFFKLSFIFGSSSIVLSLTSIILLPSMTYSNAFVITLILLVFFLLVIFFIYKIAISSFEQSL